MKAKKLENTQNLGPMDAKDRILFNALSANSREKLTSLAKKVDLSIDSTKKRVQRLEKLGIISRYTIMPDPVAYGDEMSVHIFLKFKNVSKERFDALVEKLVRNKKIIDVFSMMGMYDFFIVYIGKNADEFNSFEMQIRHEFGDIIDQWVSMLITKYYKLEEYLV